MPISEASIYVQLFKSAIYTVKEYLCSNKSKPNFHHLFEIPTPLLEINLSVCSRDWYTAFAIPCRGKNYRRAGFSIGCCSFVTYCMYLASSSQKNKVLYERMVISS